MVRRPVVLVTGAGGEIGHGLIHEIAERGTFDILALDVRPLAPDVARRCAAVRVGDILDRHLVDRLHAEFEIAVVFHLAALLSTRAEFVPETAHAVNVQGTLNLLALAIEEGRELGRPVKFLFPSSIAAYGMPDLPAKVAAGCVKEEEFNLPHTMYGCNKLYCEKLGTYYSSYYGQKHLDDQPPHMLDFRAIRFPGLISAFTLPSGGTSDYGPEMLHAAAQGKPYSCFVRVDTKISFMAMPDAIKSLLTMVDVPREKLNHQVYNIAAFALTAGEFRDRAVKAFPGARITFEPNLRRQGIVDSWPEDVDDSLARSEWGWQPDYDADAFFDDYFLPEIKKRYGK